MNWMRVEEAVTRAVFLVGASIAFVAVAQPDALLEYRHVVATYLRYLFIAVASLVVFLGKNGVCMTRLLGVADGLGDVPCSVVRETVLLVFDLMILFGAAMVLIGNEAVTSVVSGVAGPGATGFLVGLTLLVTHLVSAKLLGASIFALRYLHWRSIDKLVK